MPAPMMPLIAIAVRLASPTARTRRTGLAVSTALTSYTPAARSWVVHNMTQPIGHYGDPGGMNARHRLDPMQKGRPKAVKCDGNCKVSIPEMCDRRRSFGTCAASDRKLTTATGNIEDEHLGILTGDGERCGS